MAKSPRKPSEKAVQALFQAARRDDAAALALAFKKAGPETRNAVGRTPLMWAAEHGSTKCVQLLIPISELNATTLHSNTALSLAAHFGFDECVRLLLEAQADAGIADTAGHTPLMSAAIQDRVDCLKLLFPVSDHAALNKQGRGILAVAAAAGSGEALRFLLPRMGEPPEAKGPSLLEIAVLGSSRIEAVQYLAGGASKKAFKGALRIAAQLGRARIFEALLQCDHAEVFPSQALGLAKFAESLGQEALANRIYGLIRSDSEAAEINAAMRPAPPINKPRL